MLPWVGNSRTQPSGQPKQIPAPFRPNSSRIRTREIRARNSIAIRTYRFTRLKVALFTSYRSGAMPQPIEVKSQAEQQSLPHLCGQAATRCFGRELAFDHGEDGFYFGARPIQRPRKSAVHLVAKLSFRN